MTQLAFSPLRPPDVTSDGIVVAERGLTDWLWFTATFGVLGVLSPLLFAYSSVPSNLGTAAVLAWLIILWSALRLSMLFLSHEARPMASFFYIFTYVFMGLAMLAQVCSETFPLPEATFYPADTVTRAAVGICLGVGFFELGVAVARLHSRRAPERAVAPGGSLQFSAPRAAVLGVIGLGLVAYVLHRTGLQPFFTSRDARTIALVGPAPVGVRTYDIANKTSGLLIERAVQLPVFISLYVLLLCRRRGWKARTPSGQLAISALIALLIVANLIVNNPIGTSRFWFGLIVISLISLRIDFTSPRQLRAVTAAAILVFVVAFPALAIFRTSHGPQLNYSGVRADLITSGSYSAFQEQMNGVNYVEANGLAGANQFISAVATFVPRSLWAGKGRDTGNLVDNSGYNRAASLWTEAEVDFGVTGVALMFSLFGMAVYRMDRLARRKPTIAGIIPLLAGAEIFLLRGSLQPALGALYGLAAVFFLLVRRRRRTDVEP